MALRASKLPPMIHSNRGPHKSGQSRNRRWIQCLRAGVKYQLPRPDSSPCAGVSRLKATRTPFPAAIAIRAIEALPRSIRTAPAAPDRCPEKERPGEWRQSEARAYFVHREREPERHNVPRRAAEE